MEDNVNVCGSCNFCNSCRPCKGNRGYNETLGNRYQCPMTSCPKERATCNVEVADCPQSENDMVGCMPLAMAYVPWQQWGDVFTGECGLDHGTIFPELVKPWAVGCNYRG